MQDKMQTWNQLSINKMALKELKKMGAEPNPQMMHSTQLVQEFLSLPETRREGLRIHNLQTIEETAMQMHMLEPGQQAVILAAGGEGEVVEDRLESLAVQGGKGGLILLLLESLMTHAEEE
jgi:hypothetical protein